MKFKIKFKLKLDHPQQDEKEDTNKFEDELEEIVRISLKIKSRKLMKSFKLDENTSMNGLQLYSCESCIYTPNNVFYIQSPTFSSEKDYEYWDIGFLDIKNGLFYEVGILLNENMERIKHFYDWITFLQTIIDNKVFSKLFEFFEFDKGQFLNNDRFLHEPSFLQPLRKLTNNSFTAEFMIFLCDMMKSQNKMVSFTILKKKVCSNLKNFKENLKLTFSNSLGVFK